MFFVEQRCGAKVEKKVDSGKVGCVGDIQILITLPESTFFATFAYDC